MIDLIIYCPCAMSLDNELADQDYINENGELTFGINKTPRTYSPDKTKWSTLIRVLPDTVLPELGCVEILGTKEDVDADPMKTEKYLQCYSREPYTITDPETGESITITPPKWHGEFA